jgi:uncharacterized membrane protein
MRDFRNWTDTEIEEAEAAGALLFVIGLQVLLAVLSEQRGWKLWTLPWWIWLILVGPELVLLVLLWLAHPRGKFALSVVMGGVNLLAVIALIGSIIESHEHNGGQLLLKGLTVWATNVTAFGILFWEIGQFQFPQEQNGDPTWKPSFFDFFYVSFTNSIAFSPTDAMPFTKRAKFWMLFESVVSAISILLVASRAVNIFK